MEGGTLASTKNAQTFHDHISELRDRLMWIGGCLLVSTTLGYTLHDLIIRALMRPLDSRQTLIYTSPSGGFEFLIRISLFFGFLLTVPVIIYHIVKFVQPVLMDKSRKYLIRLLLSSILLVIAGSSFAYIITLPAALHFLTQFSTGNIQALLSTNEYLSFVMVYIAGFALLFQIPLVLLLLNKITPIPPAKLLKQGKFVLIGSFIAAALITPTPDPINQLWMAGPMVLLYGVGVLLVWLVNRPHKTHKALEPPATNLKPGTYYQAPRINLHDPKDQIEPKPIAQPIKQPLANLHGGLYIQPYIKTPEILDLRDKILDNSEVIKSSPIESAHMSSSHVLDLSS